MPVAEVSAPGAFDGLARPDVAAGRRIDSFEIARMLLGELPAGAVVLSLGLPEAGQVARAAAIPGHLTPQTALTAPLLAAHPAHAGALLRGIGGPVVAGGDGDGWLTRSVSLFGRTLITRGRRTACRDLGTLAGQLSDPGLIHLDGTPGHDRLLTESLAALSTLPALIWIDLPDPEQARRILTVPAAEAYAAYAIPDCGVPRRLTRPGPAEALLLVPTDAWLTIGLDRMEEDDTGAEPFGIPPIAARGQGLDPDLVTRLRVARPRRTGHREPSRLRLTPDLTLWGDDGLQAVRDEAGKTVYALGSSPSARLLFMAPAGTHGVSLKLGDTPEPELAHALHVTVGPDRVPLVWKPGTPRFETGADDISCRQDAPLEIRIESTAAPSAARPSIASLALHRHRPH